MSAPALLDTGDQEDLTDEVADAFIRDVLAGRYVAFGEAERVKENALAFKHLLAARRASGSLIELVRAETILFEVSRAARNAWMNWPVRVGPLIAADLGLEADRVTEVLTEHVHRHLAELGEPEADFSDPADPS